ncbi:glycoside hydrolase family protein [Paenibacillus sp. LHD-117]|uniref:glycoside hydrolase family protein n=1 Tax=Paenibacillus sp. LHD-117 TaxID=3071412 RepID=UPI0027DEDDFD|nr:glycoside hydrolase family protein [Paenibacillus sp. LHD-117]MDQ6423601.1 glycoside hydrolase family protein [Paenibacillus sp. LHD-117]
MTDQILEFRKSDFMRSLKPVGRILEDPDYNVWCCSPIYGLDGRVHVFYSRWLNKYDHLGWVAACEVAHAVADTPEGPYTFVDVALRGRGGTHWDSWSIHNPTVYQVGDRYVMLYMGSNGSELGVTLEQIGLMEQEEYLPYFHKLLNSKRVGMAVADSLDGPWARVGAEPIIAVGAEPSWDDFCTSNPAFAVTPEGKYRIYYKAWDTATAMKFNGNRKYGYAESDSLTGPYTKFAHNPVIDFSSYGEQIQSEDAYVWYEDGRYKVIMRDMGLFNHEYGLYMESADGIDWGLASIAYLDAPSYFDEPMPDLDRQGRLERPQLLMRADRPDYLFCAYRGGKYRTSSAVVLKVER